MPFSVPDRARSGSEHPAASPAADAPRPQTRAGRVRPLRPSQVPLPAETATLSRSPLSRRSEVTYPRPSAVPAQPVQDMLRGSARPLAAPVRREMEGRLGADFASVRVHTGEAARASATQLGARAYTVGDHVIIGEHAEDKHTLAHELTHVLQQRQGPVAGAGHGGLKVSDPSDAFEKAADANAARVMRAPLDGHRHAPGEDGERVASRGAGAAPPVAIVQRMVGFETELSVPTMPALPSSSEIVGKNRDNVSAPREVEGFLRGGVPYGTNMGHNGYFTLKADHNKLQNEHAALREKLKTMGYVLPAMDEKHTMSNLEYVTKPHDELAPSSTKVFEAEIQAIIVHARKLFPDVFSAAFEIPEAGTYRTGFPFTHLQKWLGADYKDVGPLIDNYASEIRESFYLQATVGIIPSALADLHNTLAPQLWASDVNQAAAKVVRETVGSLLKEDNFAKSGYVVNLRNNHKIDYEALVGLLYLIFTYLVGSALNQTDLHSGGSDKNSVPFMSKMKHLGYVINTAVPDELRTNKMPEDLARFIRKYFRDTPYVKVDYWTSNWKKLKLDSERTPTINSVLFVDDVLLGREPELISAATAEARTFSAPDPMPYVAAASGNQSGVQMEYRRIAAHPGADESLTKELMQVVKEVRKLNTRHLKSGDRDSLLKATDK